MQLQYVINLEMQEWLNTEIFPQFILLGVTKVAMLMPQEFIAQLSVEQSMDESENGEFQFQYFNNKEAAVAWLSK